VSSGGKLVIDGASVTITKGNTTGAGGAVSIENGECVMSAGKITGNKAVDKGGGVSVNGGAAIFTMSGTAEISHNQRTGGGDLGDHSGGGVSVTGGALFELNGGVIKNNTSTATGGGVSANGVGTRFVMTNGAIHDNETSTLGGGVRVDTDSSFTMSGGAIHTNSAGERGGGIFMSHYTTVAINSPASAASIYGNTSTVEAATPNVNWNNNDVGATTTFTIGGFNHATRW
jgi:hypothetical protein